MPRFVILLFLAWGSSTARPVSAAIHEGNFQQQRDHRPSGQRADRDARFAQRFFIDDDYVSQPAGAPVFFVFCGESPCEAVDQIELASDLARRFHGVIIGLEHRYYGRSQPFPELTTKHLRFLTMEQALDDVAAFQDWVSASYPFASRWTLVGSSYSGMLAAFYRARYPKRTVGAVVSSAPIYVPGYETDTDGFIAKTLGASCAAKVRETIQIVDRQLGDPVRLKVLKQRLDIASTGSDDDLIGLVSQIPQWVVQYGHRDEFCAELTTGNDTLAAYERAVRRIYEMLGSRGEDFTTSALAESVVGNPLIAAQRAWLYQNCTEVGDFAITNGEPTTIFSSRLTRRFYQRICRDTFGVNLKLDVRVTNRVYYASVLRSGTTRIFFTNGTSDPRARYSPSPTQLAGFPGLCAFTIEGASHCADTGPISPDDSPAILHAKQRALSLVGEWLRAIP